MKKKYLFLVFAIFTVVCLFATAATCSFCGINLGSADEETTESGAEAASAQNEVSSEEAASGTTASTEEEADGAEVIEDEEGAEPEPEEEPAIEEVEEPEPEPGEAFSGEDLRSFGAESTVSGQVTEDGSVFIAADSPGVPAIYVGDLASGLYVRGFLSFDVSEIAGANVLAAWFNLKASRIGDPNSLMGSFSVGATDFGPTLDGGDYNVTVDGLGGRPSGYSELSLSNEYLKNAVQDVLSSGRQYFQVRLSMGVPNSNGVADGFSILLSNVSLEVSYN